MAPPAARFYAEWGLGPRLLSAWLMLLAVASHAPGFAPARHAVGAQGGIRVISAPAPDYDFGNSITFRLTAQSTAPITTATLFVAAGVAPPSLWHAQAYQPALRVDVTVSVDLALNPLPPFAPISFWWQIDDSSGQRLTTEPASFAYEDNRFSWQTLTRGSVTVHWYRGDPSLGQEAVNIATTALPEITLDIRAPLPPRVDVYVYATDSDVQGALRRVGIAYANGHADPRLGVVIISVAPDLRASYNMQIQIPHEMTHVLIYRATGENYTHVPTWFNEGLAVMHQGQRDSSFPALLAAARDSHNFLSLLSLCGPFEPATVQLAYAESESAVRYIRAQYGAEGINRLLTAYAGGAECDAGVQAGLGLSLDQLDLQWTQSIAAPVQTPQQRMQALAPWMLLAALVLVAPLSILLIAFRGSRPRRDAGDGRMV